MKNYIFKISVVIFCLTVSFFLIQCAATSETSETNKNFHLPKIPVERTEKQIAAENALYMKQEFFGAEAVVPFQTAKARENFEKVLQKYPHDSEILQNAAELDEKLEKFDLAENELQNAIESEKENPAHFEKLAAFYARRGEFIKQAETLEKMLEITPAQNRASVLSRIFELARLHEIEKYSNAGFYRKIAADNSQIYTTIESLIKKLEEQKNFSEALKIVREFKDNFPEQKDNLLVKETDILLEMDKPDEAEKVFRAEFDPFWSEDMTRNFYNFLEDQNRFRAYENELKTAFQSDPANFDTAIRLAHFRIYEGDLAAPVISRLEKSRKEKNIAWNPKELTIAARFLISEGENDLASRFLYTLNLQYELAPESENRAKILYQIFKMLNEADEERIALTRGNLRFYRDVANADTNTGISTAILSLIFSDTNPQEELEKKERTAAKFFNRAAAYRIFQIYKKEYPTSPELAQMYLDIVRIYTLDKQPEIAESTLKEFELRYEKTDDYPNVALKIAESFDVADNPEKKYEIYQKLLDFLGKPENAERFSGETNYAEILGKYVSDLTREKKFAEILALYSSEIAKYSDNEWLYEKRAEQLETTSLADEQLKIYKTALEKFPTRNWQDRLARWFLRKDRKQEFAEFSADLIGKLSDDETQQYLANFVDSNISATDFDKNLYLVLYRAAHERFPHNITFINGLLKFYDNQNLEKEWRELAASYYFEFPEIREKFAGKLAKTGELRRFFDEAKTKSKENSFETLSYALFKADAAARLSYFEDSVAVYEHLNELYPHTPEFRERLINFARSFGQKDRDFLEKSAKIAQRQAEFEPSSTTAITRSGELQAEIGDYENAREEWKKLIATSAGEPEIYLETATVFWDYFQYSDAREIIKTLRQKTGDETLYAFQTGAIYEAEHDLPEAVGEYVKALDANDPDYDFTDSDRAKNRLIKLAARKPESFDLIKTAFQKQRSRQKDDSFLILSYAEFLRDFDAKFNEKSKARENVQNYSAEGINLIKNAILKSRNKNFIEAAKDFFRESNETKGKQIALRRLAEISQNRRDSISYRLKLAESFTEEDEREKASSVLREMLAEFPTNYGVLDESARLFREMNKRAAAIDVLKSGASRGKGEYKYIFRRKLAAHLEEENQITEAENILRELHRENASDAEVFRELAGIFVKTKNADALRESFDETLESLKKQDLETRNFNYTVAELRRQMIDAFTTLKDFDSAIRQHIEIVNREPEDEENVEAAIRYAKRYGGATVLIDYYKKNAAEAFKNYRWNVILAKLYLTENDFENAAENYKTAILNQPEMPELYVSLAEIETKRQNFDSAVENINRVLELTNDAPEYLEKKIEILETAGRFDEAEAVRNQLPAELKPEKVKANDFQTARKLEANEKIAAYRRIFGELLENPTAHEVNSGEINDYVKTLRDAENLDEIAERLFIWREKLIAETEREKSLNTAKANSQLQILSSAMPEAIGKIAANNATSDENQRLRENLEKRINEAINTTDKNQTVSLIQNLASRAGFGNLVEQILVYKKDSAFDEKDSIRFHSALKALIDFYAERGIYAKSLEILENERERDKDAKNFDYFSQIAKYARINGNTEKELQVLREYFQKTDSDSQISSDALTARYLEILYAGGERTRGELISVSEKDSPFRLQIINFLLGRGEIELAHKAIEAANFPSSWKLSRHAETSLALREYEDSACCYFINALNLASIGELTKQKPEKKSQIVGDDWFSLAREYGEWLYFAPKKSGDSPNDFLPALIEQKPKSAEEQAKIGAFYLEQKDAKNALEHLVFASEMDGENKQIKADLGAAYFLNGENQKARQIWAEIIADSEPEIDDAKLYFKTLAKNDLAAQAREEISPLLETYLNDIDEENSRYYVSGNDQEREDLKSLIRILSESFSNQNEKFVYFRNLAEKVDGRLVLPKIVVNENLVEKDYFPVFYEMIIKHAIYYSYEKDYDFETVAEKNPVYEDALEIYDHEKNFQIKEPETEKILFQKEFLDFLLKNDKKNEAEKLIVEVEKDLKNDFASPVWLRLAKLNLQFSNDKTAFYESAKRFAGIKTKTDVPDVKPPNIERLNEILDFLRGKNDEVSARNLLKDFYARQIALGQYSEANFNGLVRIFFENGEAENGLRLLNLGANIAMENEQPKTIAELADWEIIKSHAVEDENLADTQEIINLNQSDFFEVSAETAREFGQIPAAIEFRRKLKEIASENTENLLKLAELFIENGTETEAADVLTKIINSRLENKNLRWRAVWTARKLSSARPYLLNKVNSAETELRDALEILFSPNIKIKTKNPSSEFWFFVGIVAEVRGQNEIAFQAFINSNISGKDAPNSTIFETETVEQKLMRLYLKSGKINSAFELADADKSPRPFELLDLLTIAAENSGDFVRAINYEKGKNSPDEMRIENLQNLNNEKLRKVTDFTVGTEKTRKL